MARKQEGWERGTGHFHKDLEPNSRLRPPPPVSKASIAKAKRMASGMRGGLDIRRGGSKGGGGRFVSG
jgi:hypothetical protein